MKEPAKNPIERRLDYLVSLWNEFAKAPDPRLLRWRVDDDGARMVELLVEVQNEEGGNIPDLFIRFNDPFTDVRSYPAALLHSLQEQYEASREEIASADLPADWCPPSPQAGESSLRTFVRTCCSFQQYYEGKMLVLALFLAPSQIAGAGEWRDFLKALVQIEIPPTVRFMVFDHCDRPLLDQLCAAEPKRIKTSAPDLDMGGALEEIADSAAGVGPGNDFRKLFVRLGNLTAAGNVAAANRTAVAALRITRRQKWFDLQAAVYMMLGAMHLGRQDHGMALKAYQFAGKAATEAEKTGNPAGTKLVVQTRFAEAAALVARESYGEAAPVYEQTAPLAKTGGDVVLEVEAWRMASYCHEMTGRTSDAWRCGNRALDAAEALDDELRANSTLPYLGQRLLNLLKAHQADHKYERQVRERMVALVGEGWEDQISTRETAPS